MWQDLGYGARMLLRRPGFTAAAVLSLALGIGASTAIFSVVDGVLLRSLPYPEPDRVAMLKEVSEKGTMMNFAEPNFLDLRARSRSLEASAQYSVWLRTVMGGSEPARARVASASNEFFKVMGVPPLAGRAFVAEDAKGAAVAVIGYGFWQRLLGGKPDFGGATLKIDDRSYAVVGVMPPGFSFPQEAEVWIPREVFAPETSRTAHNWWAVGRLRAGVTLEQARADLSAIGRQLKEEHGKSVDAAGLAAVPLREFLVGDVRRVLWVIFGAVGFLLLVACANVANLLLAQTTARRKEFTVRSALGATRWRLARQFVMENVLLALAAGGLGVLFSHWGVSLLIGLNRRALPRAGEIVVDARALAFTLALSLLIAVVLGLVPALRLGDADLQAGLKEAGRGQSADRASHRLRGLLVVTQVALTLLLLAGAGLLGRSFFRLLRVDPGFRAESAVVMDLSLPRFSDERRGPQLMQAFRQLQERGGEVGNPAFSPEYEVRRGQQAKFYEELLDRFGALPGVLAVGGTSTLPLMGTGPDGTFWVDNSRTNVGYAGYRQVSPGYFAAMGIPLVRGRLFDQNDKRESPHVAVVSQALAQKYWPGEEAIGKRLQFGNMDGDLRLLHVVGVVGDVRDGGLDKEVSRAVYAYALQRPISSSLSVVVRAQGDPAPLLAAMRQTVRSLDAELPMNFRTLEQIFSSSLDQRRFSLVVFGVFAVVALLLAVMGIYGVMTYAVSQRTSEIGIRVALGATAGDIQRLILGQGLRLIAPGVVVGLAGALALTRLLASLLFGVGASDPVTFAGVAGLLAAVALLACYLPARRATRVDPLVALRHD